MHDEEKEVLIRSNFYTLTNMCAFSHVAGQT